MATEQAPATTFPPELAAFEAQHSHAWPAKRKPGMLPHLAIQHNNLHVLQQVDQLSRLPDHAHDPRLNMQDAMNVAVKHNNLVCLQWLHDHTTLSLDKKAMATAIKAGHNDIAKWLHVNRPGDVAQGMTPAVMDHVARKGDLDMLCFLHEHRTEGCTTSAMENAAYIGRMDIVAFLHQHRSEGCTTRAMDLAAEAGHMAMVQFLHDNRTEGCSQRAMDAAAEYGHLGIVQFLHHHRTEGCTQDAMDKAAENGHLDVVRFLHDHRSEGCTAWALDYAALNGHTAIFQLLHARYPQCCTHHALRNAAFAGHFELLQFLLDNCREGCLMDAAKWAFKRPDIVAFLQKQRSAEVDTCHFLMHDASDERRRCQA